ncbi:MAG: tyrosine-type recombinase/integrase [Halobacteriovoraceae bacterium]|nr:tyrosine-type recombinase/integrase [Halobacteriovoraceae bacterium]MCB9095741.1 tyrosine-type recombinase/integrase [Halobacteriovoraceae bacterium]
MENISLENILPLQKRFLKSFEEKGKSANSLKCYRLDFECFNEFITNFPNKEINDFNNRTVQEFHHYLEKKYGSINSIRRKLQTLRLFFDFLVEKKEYAENPIKKIASAPKSLLPPLPVKFPEVYRVFDYLKKQIDEEKNPLAKLTALRNCVLYATIYEAGLNVAPISKLREEDVIVDEDEIRIIIASSKRDPYTVPMTGALANIFTQYLQTLAEVKNDQELEFPEFFFFANNYKIIRGGLSPRGIEDIFQKISKNTDIKVTPKTLRQSCIVRWLVQKKPDSSIKEWMGVAPSYSLNNYKTYIKENKENSGPDILDYSHLNFQ